MRQELGLNIILHVSRECAELCVRLLSVFFWCYHVDMGWLLPISSDFALSNFEPKNIFTQNYFDGFC